MPTIKDVAARAGVSNMTVSRVINRDPAVRDVTRERVERVIAELGYAPDAVARSLRRQRTGSIGVVTDSVVTTTYAVNLIRGIQDTCKERGWMALIIDTPQQADLKHRAFKALVQRKVEGIIYATTYLREVFEPPMVGTLPVVLVNCFARGSAVPTIVPDDFRGGYTATRHLIERGHRDIGVVLLSPGIEAARLRVAGHGQAMADYGLPYDPEMIQAGQVERDGREVFTTEEAVRTLFAARRPSALACGTDVIAMRVYNAIRNLGLRIPHDVSIVGYDNYLEIVESLDPELTTVALPYRQMGTLAAQWLGRLLDGEEIPEPFLKVPCPLVERHSCRDRQPRRAD